MEAMMKRIVTFTANPTLDVSTSVGAGDSMVAGVVVALARGWPLAKATRFGLAAGSAAVMAPGTGLCARANTERLFALMGTRATATP
jgi:6-phosphofructokinase 2